MERPTTVAITRTRQITSAEEEAIAAVQGVDVLTAADGQEGGGGVDEGSAFPGDVGEVVSPEWVTLKVEALVEESDEGVG